MYTMRLILWDLYYKIDLYILQDFHCKTSTMRMYIYYIIQYYKIYTTRLILWDLYYETYTIYTIL